MGRFLLLALLALCGLLLIGKEVFERYTAAFPELPPGVYVGQLITDSNTRSAIPWLVTRFPGERSLAVSIGDVRLPAQRVAPVDPSGKTRLPLIVGEGPERLRCIGREVEAGIYQGSYRNPTSQVEGTWTLRKLANQEPSPVIEQGLVRWFAVRQEIERIEAEIQEVQAKADQQRLSIDNLHRYVSEDDTLRKTAGVRLGRADSELEAARSELVQRQQQLDRASRDFELSQRISEEGKLVFLSRETIQLESRWIELSLKLLAPETSLGFDQALERAEKVRRLKNQIRKEREEVVEASTIERHQGRSDETRREEEFYGNLQ